MNDTVNIKVFENTQEGMLAAVADAENRLNQKIEDALLDSIVIGDPTAVIVPTGNVHCLGVGPGTYANWGGLVVPDNNTATLRRVDGVFSMSLTPTDLSGKLNVSDIVDSFASSETNKPGTAKNDKLLNEKFDLYATNENLAQLEENLNTTVSSIASGSPKGTFANLTALQAAFPTGNTNIYVTSNDGHWYYYNAGWQDGGLYQTPLQITGDIIATDGSDITSVLQSSIDTLKFVSIKKAGTYLVSASIQMPSNSSLYLAAGVVLKLANGTNDEILTNANYAAGNENITVFGEGTFNCNGANNTNAGSSPTDSNAYQMTGILFKNCKNLFLKDFTVKNPKYFGIQLGKTTNFIVKDITFDYPDFGGDGLHINGQCHFGFVENLKSPYNITRDDLFALVAKDTPMFNIYEGAITNIKCNGISALNSYNAVRIISAGYEVSDISINDISGTYQAQCINIDDYRTYITQVGESIIKKVSISNVRANIPINVNGLIRIATKIQSISFNNIIRIETGVYATPTFKIDLYGDVDLLTLNNVEILDYTNQAVNGNCGIKLFETSRVGTLKLNNYTHKYLGTNANVYAGYLILLSTATIDNLLIDNLVVDDLSTLVLVSNSIIGNLSFSNFVIENIYNMVIVNVEAGQVSNVPVIKLFNGVVKLNNDSANIFSFSATLSNPIKITTEAVTFKNFSGSPIEIQTGQGIQVSVNSVDLELNPVTPTGRLTPLKNDIIKRKNSDLAMNDGLAIYDGGNFFLLSSGINYSDSHPGAGTWKVGNRILNYSPWVGQPKSWICTEAGAPGTWVSEGNL